MRTTLYSLVLIFVFLGCSKSKNLAQQTPPAIVNEDNTPAGPTQPHGQLPPQGMKLSNLPNESFIVIQEQLDFIINRLSTSGTSARAFFQNQGIHAYGPGSEGWATWKTPLIYPQYQSCSFTLNLDKVTPTNSDSNRWRINPGQHIVLTQKSTPGSSQKNKNKVSLATLEDTGSLKEFSCDQLSLQEIEADIFGGKIKFYIPL